MQNHKNTTVNSIKTTTNTNVNANTNAKQSNESMTNEYIGRTGGEIFHDTLAELGVKSVFGYPGGAILPVFDAIYQSKHMKFILTRHEQGAAHMAEGVAQVTGQPGVVLVTSGPGATNTITAMQDALMDGRPMVVFCGQVATSVLGTDAFQEADVLGISRPCTKWNIQVRDVHDMARNIHEAFHIATTGRPGPVLVDLPKDIAASVCKKPITKEPRLLGNYSRKSNAVTVYQEDKFKRVVNLLKKAKKPIIIAGHGAINACDEVRELAMKYNIPVTTTLHGLGVFDETHPLSLHMMGMHGSAYANKAVQEADLLLVIGSRFDDRITGAVSAFAPKAMSAGLSETGGIVHFDICTKQISKIIPANVAIAGDAKKNLKKLLPCLDDDAGSSQSWLQHIQTLKKKYPFRYRPSEPNAQLKPQRVIEELYTQTKTRNDIVITTGVGQHQMWAAQYYRWKKPRTLVTSGGLGTMGFGLPTALGVKVARSECTVVDIDGDASFSMTLQEMATASAYNIGVKVLLLNNDFQGMVRQWQDLFYEKRYCGTEMVNPNFCAVAEGMNWKALRCTKEEEVAETMEKFLKTDGPVLAEFIVDKREHCYPMVGAGKPLSDIILGDFDDCRPTTSQ